MTALLYYPLVLHAVLLLVPRVLPECLEGVSINLGCDLGPKCLGPSLQFVRGLGRGRLMWREAWGKCQ